MAEYGTAHIPLEKCADLFGLSPRKACEAACRQRLPVPSFRLGSQKSPWLVDAHVLAKYLDEQKLRAKSEWEKMKPHHIQANSSNY
ncbi:pyocin activator PrtN family protein [Delftia acidovorans]|uniref:pyocin activator PrtN family protein n=1 Tax=Delftia acidovorans TaxID=80866 RepID=UPI0039C86CA1